MLHLLCTVCEPTKSKKTISKSEQGRHFETNFVEDFSIFAKGFDQSLSDFFFFFKNEKIFVDVNITPKVLRVVTRWKTHSPDIDKRRNELQIC